jgi:ubiquinone/menaquinone biosynthesis C-methylase UbiE
MTTTLTPAAYDHWRATPLGRLTEQAELRLVFELAGSLAGKRVLDVGTGDATYAIEAAARGAEVTAIDPSAAMLEAARSRAARHGVSLQLREGRIESLPFDAECFDVVLAVTVLCFVDDVTSAFRELARVLVPGGRLVVGELGRWSVWAAKRRLQSLGRQTLWSAAHFWTRRELERSLTEAGLRIEASSGAVYFPPITAAARLMAPIDPVLARLGATGAAFLCTAARKPG